MTHRPLTPEDLLGGGSLLRLGCRVLTFGEIDSTNNYLKAYAAELPDGTIATAEVQTAGRGRLGRAWQAPRGAGLLLSVLLHERAGSPWIALAGVLGAVAACEAIEITIADCAPRLRWPNDLLLGGRKLGGVLAEALARGVPGGGGGRSVVIGIGLNCLQQRGHFPPELAERATSLELASRQTIDRQRLAGALVARLDAWLTGSRAAAGGLAPLDRAWRERCDDLGARVTLRHDGRVYTGTVLDFGEHGDLVVQLDQGGRTRFAAATTTRDW